jgi:chromosome segregation protein
MAELTQLLPVLEAEEAAGAAEADRRMVARQQAQESLAALRSRRAEIEARADGLAQRRSYLGRRLAEVEERLARHGAERAEAGARRQEIEVLSTRTGRLAGLVEQVLAAIEAELVDVRDRRDRQARALAGASGRLEELRRRRQASERALEEVRERFRRAELDDAEARMRTEAAVEALRRELDSDPDVAVAAPCPLLPAGTSPPTRVRELERELRLMGPVNPLALEELAALQERHAFLGAQLDDVKGTRRELTKVIRAVEAEMAQLLAAAYADVADHFTRLFETLFPGGQGRLRLTDPDNLLEAGIEVEARPAGKNVRKLSLLSGGERSLVAVAFLFAVFRSRPSPFYLLDEVEAALDDVNLTRFLDLLGEFRQEAQLLVVTHQKRTMEAADCLYGVTMQPGGSSRVLSERMRAPA